MELSESGVGMGEQLTVNAATQFTKANKHALHFLMGAQAAMLEEMVFAGYEMLDRTRTEMHLFTEFVSKMSGAHSHLSARLSRTSVLSLLHNPVGTLCE